MKNILIIEDDLAISKGIQISLEEDSYTIQTADDGDKGYTLALKNSIDLIILDLMMPEMSGWEVFDKLRDNPDWRQIPIIFLTARADRIAENAGEFLGKDFINKPVENEELINRVKIALENKD